MHWHVLKYAVKFNSLLPLEVLRRLYSSHVLNALSATKCQQKLFKEMQAEEDMARSEEREWEATVSDEEMARR